MTATAKMQAECSRQYSPPARAAFEGKGKKEKKYGKQEKGERRMPWLSEATKGAVSCEKPGVGANGH